MADRPWALDGAASPTLALADSSYVGLVRELGEATRRACDPECSDSQHRREAAEHINAMLCQPELLWKLVIVKANLQRLRRAYGSPDWRGASSDSGSAG